MWTRLVQGHRLLSEVDRHVDYQTSNIRVFESFHRTFLVTPNSGTG